MFESLDLMRMAQSMAVHAATQQNAISQNVAHADTPGYEARDVAPFAETYRANGADHMRATRAGHFDAREGDEFTPQTRIDPNPITRAPNGNTVSLEHEMMRGIETRQQHEMALGVYSSVRNILRTSLGR
jgi:flagellar basal-body rod protein FlgB